MESQKAKTGKKLTKTKRGVIRAKSDFFRTARYGLTLQEHRIIYYAILKGQQDGTPFAPVTLAIKDFKELCDLKGESSYNTVRNLSKKITGKTVEVVYKDGDGRHLMQAAWLSSIIYHTKEGKVTITPNTAIKPFFEGKPFTETEYFFLVKFTSQYAERLYEIIKTLDNKRIIDFDIEDLRNRLSIGKDQYSNFNMLRCRVLDPAVQDINEFTDLDISIKEKRGQHNRVETVYFTVSKKSVPKLYDRISSGEYIPPLSDEQEIQLLQELLGEDTQMQCAEGIPGQLDLLGVKMGEIINA